MRQRSLGLVRHLSFHTEPAGENDHERSLLRNTGVVSSKITTSLTIAVDNEQFFKMEQKNAEHQQGPDLLLTVLGCGSFRL